MIHVISVPAFKPENDAPVGCDPDGVKMAEVACERVKPVSRDIDIFNSVCSVYRRKPVLDFGNLIRRQSPRDPFVKKALQPPALEALDHN
jgi:hypothetical protein